ncbi:hypothetical protein FV276_04415 [Escherichia coli]|nr:hypothetical protein [Escherichia coli]TXP96245.1 hypothetical protein FV276_04415 [Escherichia coli]TXQ01613.1 hypothetical protein FV284_00470 [Escherichia coli]
MVYVRNCPSSFTRLVFNTMILDAFFMTSGTSLVVRFDTFCGQKKAHQSELLIGQCAASVGSVIGILCAIEVTLRFRNV